MCDSHGGILSQMVYKADLNDNLPDTATKMQQLIQNSNFTNTNAIMFVIWFFVCFIILMKFYN